MRNKQIVVPFFNKTLKNQFEGKSNKDNCFIIPIHQVKLTKKGDVLEVNHLEGVSSLELLQQLIIYFKTVNGKIVEKPEEISVENHLSFLGYKLEEVFEEVKQKVNDVYLSKLKSK